MATYSGSSLRVNRAITGATTVASNGFVTATYRSSSTSNASPAAATTGTVTFQNVIRFFGPNQSVPATFSQVEVIYQVNQGSTAISQLSTTMTYTLISGVEFVNNP